jgi:uncharacterized membrane protein YczE
MVLILLLPGIVSALTVGVLSRKELALRWWEFIIPWIAPGTWIYLNASYWHYRPLKSVGNMIEIILIGLFPAGYFIIRHMGFKRALPNWAYLPVGIVAAAVGAAIYFLFPEIPE